MIAFLPRSNSFATGIGKLRAGWQPALSQLYLEAQLSKYINSPASMLLPRHGDADGFLRINEVIDTFGILFDGQLNALYAARKLISARPVVW